MTPIFPTEAKLKELLSGLSSLTLSEADALSLVTVLQQKSPSAMEAWHKVRYCWVTCADKVFLIRCSSHVSHSPVGSTAWPSCTGTREAAVNAAGGGLHRQGQSQTAQSGLDFFALFTRLLDGTCWEGTLIYFHQMIHIMLLLCVRSFRLRSKRQTGWRQWWESGVQPWKKSWATCRIKHRATSRNSRPCRWK